MPELLGYARRALPGHTAPMAKQARTKRPSRPTTKRVQRKLMPPRPEEILAVAEQMERQAKAQQARREFEARLATSATKVFTAEQLRAHADDLGLYHPLQVDALQELAKALKAVGIDPHKAAQPDEFLRDAWHQLGTARTEHAELVALAVEHANDARAQSASKPRTMREMHQEDDALRARVQATMMLRRNMRLPEGMQDDRRPVIMDGEIITLVGPQDEARSALVTLKLPQVVIDRLRDAVAATGPKRTMAGIAALGITMVLDVLEAEHLKHTGRRIPKRPGQVLEGGRPSRTRATTAQEAPIGAKGPKKRGGR